MILSNQRLIEIRRDLHKIPEIGLAEFKTQSYLLEIIKQFPQEKLTITKWQTGLLVKVKGTNSRKIIGWRTDMDGLPITEQTGLPFSSVHEGRMHACGHDFHMTIALGLLANVIAADFQDDYLFIFQPAEENEAGAKLLFDSGILENNLPEQLYALHVQPALPVGKISTKTGTLFAGDCEFFLTLKGQGGHGAYPDKSNDMIVAASQLIQQIQTIVSRNVNPMEGAVVTVASIHGGEATNIIPETVSLSGSIRSLSQHVNDLTQKRLKEIIAGIELSFQCQIDVKLDQKGYLPVVNHQKLTIDFIEFVKQDEGVTFIEAESAMIAEDFGYFLTKMPGMMFWLGVETPFDLHHNQLAPREEALEVGIKTVFAYFENVLDR